VAQQLTWWHQLHNGWGGSDYATINKKRGGKDALVILAGSGGVMAQLVASASQWLVWQH
jgi:hypothetical protein